jgi:long-subunit acyl-CoA synthetase (AMP-forming)
MSVAWAAHRLNGIATPANAAYGLEELIHQLKSSGAKCIFTNVVLLDTALKAAETVGIPHKHIYILELPEAITGAKKTLSEFKTVDQLIEVGKKIGAPEKLRWKKGQGAKQVAFLCYSSGTSGLPVSGVAR